MYSPIGSAESILSEIKSVFKDGMRHSSGRE